MAESALRVDEKVFKNKRSVFFSAMALDVDGVDSTVHSQLDRMASVAVLFDNGEKKENLYT